MTLFGAKTRFSLVALVVASLGSTGFAQSSSVTLLDFEDDAQIEHVRSGEFASIELTRESKVSGRRAAKLVFDAVPQGQRRYTAVVVQRDGLAVRDFSPFEAISLWVMNPDEEDAELSLSVWDKDGNRSFPIPSTVTIKPGEWQQVVVRLALHGLDAKEIGSLHFFQKVNRRPYRTAA